MPFVFVICKNVLKKLLIHDVAKKLQLLDFAALTANLPIHNSFAAIREIGAGERKPNVFAYRHPDINPLFDKFGTPAERKYASV